MSKRSKYPDIDILTDMGQCNAKCKNVSDKEWNSNGNKAKKTEETKRMR